MRPYLFLDVDGVLNRGRLDNDLQDDWQDWETHKLAPFNGLTEFILYLSPSMCKELEYLPVDIIWLTTWGEEAVRLVAPCVGISEHLVAGTSLKEVSKLACLENFMDNHGRRPFIWIDDYDIPSWCEDDFEQCGYEFLLIRPDYDIGITRDHINEIRKFIGKINE